MEFKSYKDIVNEASTKTFTPEELSDVDAKEFKLIKKGESFKDAKGDSYIATKVGPKEIVGKLKESLDEAMPNDKTIPSTVKKVQTKAWAKKNKDYFHDIITNAGDKRGLSKEPTDAERRENFGKPSIVSKQGLSNYRAKLQAVISREWGVNIAEQVDGKLSDDAILKSINAIRDAWNIKSMVLSESIINEKKADDAEIVDALGKLKGVEPEALRVAIMNRQKTNTDGKFQAEYFYGKEKALSKKDSERIVKFMMSMKNWTTEEDVLRVLLGSSGIKESMTAVQVYWSKDGEATQPTNVSLTPSISKRIKADLKDKKIVARGLFKDKSQGFVVYKDENSYLTFVSDVADKNI